MGALDSKNPTGNVSTADDKNSAPLVQPSLHIYRCSCDRGWNRLSFWHSLSALRSLKEASQMIIEDHSHEVKDVEPAARSPETALFLTPPSYDPGLPPPIYDPTVPLLLSQRFGKRRHDIPFVCWFIASLIVFAVFVEIVFIPALKQ